MVSYQNIKERGLIFKVTLEAKYASANATGRTSALHHDHLGSQDYRPDGKGHKTKDRNWEVARGA